VKYLTRDGIVRTEAKITSLCMSQTEFFGCLEKWLQEGHKGEDYKRNFPM